MHDSIITLTTDFGEESPYVAAMKGVILAINPAARIVDLSHQVPAQDLRYTAFFLATAIPFFASEVIHVVVVDPGVGSSRALLHVDIAGHRLLVPDNGCWSALARALGQPPTVLELTETRWWRQPVSHTFHGRDILAPVAAHLSLGVAPEAVGTAVGEWTVLAERRCQVAADRLTGEVEFVDHFGNLITNIPGAAFRSFAARPIQILVGGHVVPHYAQTYADVAPGTLLALLSSWDHLEIAIRDGHAARQLQAQVGTEVVVAARGGS